MPYGEAAEAAPDLRAPADVRREAEPEPRPAAPACAFWQVPVWIRGRWFILNLGC